jgi:phosphatidate cytidylyltransferase
MTVKKRRSSNPSPKDTAAAEEQHEMSGPPESKLKKMIIRVIAALVMVSFAAGVILFGRHLGAGAMVSFLTICIFNELVNVAHTEANANLEIPWFRTVPWLWFLVASHLAYSQDGLSYAPMNLSGALERNVPYIGSELGQGLIFLKNHSGLLSLWVYSITFVVSVLALRKKHLTTQLHILSFTVLALSLFVIPMKMAIHNAFAGLFWFIFPVILVAVNDSFAYFCGFFLKHQIFGEREFLSISPNKTWEGFVGGGIFTVLAGFFLPLLLNHKFLTCSYDAIEAVGGNVSACVPNEELFGNEGYDSGNFKILNIQYHGIILALFASTVAPFGGFLASAIKRVYGLKDFANFIPGHGGFMDRLDCQFLMALATFVHLRTFVLVNEDMNFTKVLRSAIALSPEGREKLCRELSSFP